MKIFSSIKKLFFKELTPREKCIRRIRKMGYKKQYESNYKSKSSSGTTIIRVGEDSIFIKSYFNGIAESDTLNNAFADLLNTVQPKQNTINLFR